MNNKVWVLNKNVELKASFEWLRDGFQVFREAPIQFIVLTLISGLSSIIPALGAFLAPFFTAKFAILANKVERGERVVMGDLFKDMFANKSLVTLSTWNVLWGLIVIIGQRFAGNTSFLADFSIQTFMLLISILIVQTLFWLSPIICEYDREIKVIDAMLLSLKASFYNAAVMILYALLIVAFMLISLIPVGLGLFILLPVINISNYYIYKSLFVSKDSI